MGQKLSLEQKIAANALTLEENFDGEYFRYDVMGFGHHVIVPATNLNIQMDAFRSVATAEEEYEAAIFKWATEEYKSTDPVAQVSWSTGYFREFVLLPFDKLVEMTNLEIPAEFETYKANRSNYVKKDTKYLRKAVPNELVSLQDAQKLSLVADLKTKVANVYGFGYAGSTGSVPLLLSLLAISNGAQEDAEAASRSICLQTAASAPLIQFVIEEWPEVDPNAPVQDDRQAQMTAAFQQMMMGQDGQGDDGGEPDFDTDGNPIAYDYPRCLGCGKHHGPEQ